MASIPLKWTVLALGAAALVGASTAHANLLTNGSFESGAFVNQGSDTMSPHVGSTVITGWNIVTDTTGWIGPTSPWGLHASDGDYFLDLTNYETGAPFAGVTQSITTIPGATYLLSFDLGGSTFWGRPDSLVASAAGSSRTFVTPGTGTNDDWYHETMTFVAASSSTLIDLQGASGTRYIGLDNASVDLVSVGTVPEPGALSLMFAGLLAVTAGARRRAGR